MKKPVYVVHHINDGYLDCYVLDTDEVPGLQEYDEASDGKRYLTTNFHKFVLYLEWFCTADDFTHHVCRISELVLGLDE